MKYLKTLILLPLSALMWPAGARWPTATSISIPRRRRTAASSAWPGIYHFELVVARDSKEAKDNPVIVYVTDHANAKISTVGAGGTATILAGKQKASVNAGSRWRQPAQGCRQVRLQSGHEGGGVGHFGRQARRAGTIYALAPMAAPAKDGHMDHKH